MAGPTNQERIERLLRLPDCPVIVLELATILDLLARADAMTRTLLPFLGPEMDSARIRTLREQWIAALERTRPDVAAWLTTLEEIVVRDLPASEARPQ